MLLVMMDVTIFIKSKNFVVVEIMQTYGTDLIFQLDMVVLDNQE